MNKNKARATPAQQLGLYKPEAVKDVAESLNITNLSGQVASVLASDVEYRINQVVEEASRFMRHGKRTTLTTSDIDQALRVLNIEPLYGHLPSNPPTFRRTLPFPQVPSGPVYFVEDEEIDFDRVFREEKLTLPKSVTWTAHWLAIEGVQPLIPENPPAIPRETEPEAPKTLERLSNVLPPTPPSSNQLPSNQSAKKQQPQQQLVKQVLSRELQLYYARLTSSLFPATGDETKVMAALTSLRHDAGLQALLPYLIRWVDGRIRGALKDGAQGEEEGKILEVSFNIISAILENNTLFVEPYLHQIIPPILSTLLHSVLPPTHATHIRISASQTLSHLLTQYSATYPSLSPRIMKTLLFALISVGKSKGTREGAIRGLVSVGREAIRKGLVEGGGAKVVGSECASEGSEPLVKAVIDAFMVLEAPSEAPVPLDLKNETDVTFVTQMHEVVGSFFSETLMHDATWARRIINPQTAA